MEPTKDTPLKVTPTVETSESVAQPVPVSAVSKEGTERRAAGRRDEDRRQSVLDRRSGLDRRRGPGRRRTEDRRSAEEGEMTAEQFEFVLAVNEYKDVNRRPFPSWTEVLDIVTALGYRKVAPKQDIQ